MYKTAVKPCFAGKIQGGGRKKGQIQATFCQRAPKTKVYKKNFWEICNFKQNQGSIMEIFEKNCQFWPFLVHFRRKSADFRFLSTHLTTYIPCPKALGPPEPELQLK